MNRNRGIYWTLAILTIVGALNWGLVGFFNFNLVDAIFGGGAREETSGLSRVIYALVGLCGLAFALMLSRTAAELPPGKRVHV
jgi:uncharacterized membrane protein YuzA (DUF378 family)